MVSFPFNLHVGADSAADNKIAVKIESMSAAGIGVKDLKVDTEDDATAAIDRIAEAVAEGFFPAFRSRCCSEQT